MTSSNRQQNRNLAVTLANLPLILSLATDKTYEREAPHGETRFIVWHMYNTIPVRGDDQIVCEFERVQLDVYWQRKGDTLLQDLKSVLNSYHIPYDVQDITWEDERHLNRCIIHLTVV